MLPRPSYFHDSPLDKKATKGTTCNDHSVWSFHWLFYRKLTFRLNSLFYKNTFGKNIEAEICEIFFKNKAKPEILKGI